MPRNNVFEIAAWALATALCIFIGYGDLHTDDTGIIVGLILVSAFLLAALRPAHAWRWGVMFGLAIAVAELYNFYAVAPRPSLKPPASLTVVVTVVTAIALAGAYLGAGVRKLLESK